MDSDGIEYWNLVNSIHVNQQYTKFEEFESKFTLITQAYNLKYSTASSRLIKTDNKLKKKNIPFNQDLYYSELFLVCKGRDDDKKACPSKVKLSAAQGKYQTLVCTEYFMDHNHRIERLPLDEDYQTKEMKIIEMMNELSVYLHNANTEHLDRAEDIIKNHIIRATDDTIADGNGVANLVDCILNNSIEHEAVEEKIAKASAQPCETPAAILEKNVNVANEDKEEYIVETLNMNEPEGEKRAEKIVEKKKKEKKKRGGQSKDLTMTDSISKNQTEGEREVDKTKGLALLAKEKKQQIVEIKAFYSLAPFHQLRKMLKMMQVPKLIRNAVCIDKFECLLKASDLKVIPVECISFSQEGYDLLIERCTASAKTLLEKSIKKWNTDWSCSYCGKQKSKTNKSIMCDACLLWYHTDCILNKFEEKEAWFCANCVSNSH